MEDQHTDEGQPGHDGVVYAVVQEIDAEKGFVMMGVPRMP